MAEKNLLKFSARYPTSILWDQIQPVGGSRLLVLGGLLDGEGGCGPRHLLLVGDVVEGAALVFAGVAVADVGDEEDVGVQLPHVGKGAVGRGVDHLVVLRYEK